MFLNLFLNQNIKQAFTNGQKTLIIPCTRLGEAFFLKEKTAKELKGFNSLVCKSELSLSYVSGLKLIFCNKKDVERQKQIHPSAVVIKYLKINADYIFYSLVVVFFCLFLTQAILITYAILG
jgi:hypothetical protein